MTIRIPVFQLNSLDERELRSGLNAELRATPFTSGLIEGTEMTIDNGYNQNNYGYYEFEILGSNLTKLLKLYVSADGTNFSVIDTWGGTNGIRLKEYLSYACTLSQFKENAPTVTINNNDIGVSANVSYLDIGRYSFAFPHVVFNSVKTQVYCSLPSNVGKMIPFKGDFASGLLIIESYDNNGILTDDILTFADFEIRIYP